jgi:allophanate hydrolase
MIETMGTREGDGDSADALLLFVVGAHLSGEPLNHQLTSLGGRLSAIRQTSANYRLYALPGTPARPGMVRPPGSRQAIEGEVWALLPTAFGHFVSRVPAPLTIGKVEIETGELVCGFLCEAHAVTGCEDITVFGGWRRYRHARPEQATS